jgi:uncharacterized protein
MVEAAPPDFQTVQPLPEMPMRLRPWFATLLLALVSLAVQAEEPRTITVSGSGRVNVVPDTARISLAVERRDPVMRTARDATVKVTRDFLALCSRLGIKESRIQTAGLTMQPEYRWDEKQNQQVFIGYFVQRQLAVEVNDLDRLGELIEGAVDIGVNQVSPPMFDSSKRPELTRQALAAASEDARANAERIAATLGVKLGPVRLVAAGDGFGPPPMPLQRMQMKGAMLAEAAMAAPPAETYTPGDILIESRVSASFDVLVP